MLGVDQYIVQVYYNKDIQLFSQNLIDVSLEYSRSIRKAKKHNLVFEVAVLGLKSGLPLITLTNLHLMIGIDEIQLGESLCLTKPIQQLANQR